MRIDGQMTIGDIDPEYQGFLDKFKPKKTTDDCYTPDNIYQTILEWVVEEYGIDPDNVVRPFWPGGDYMNFDYPEGCTVVDNPPFSILSQIINNYNATGIKYFLFAPYLTNLNSGKKCSHIIAAASITYENGAEVGTSFVTNLDKYLLRACPDLNRRIKAENDKNLAAVRKQVPKYAYPDEVISSTDLGYMATHDTALAILPEDCFFIRAMDAQKEKGKAIFGGGFLLSERAAAEKAAAEKAAAVKWQLSEREKQIVRSLGKEDK